MAKLPVGLDIGTSAIRAAEIGGREPPELVRFAQVALPQGAVAGGEIDDVGAVSAAIRRLWRDGGFASRRVATAVANQKVIVRQVEVPYMEEEELRGALGFQVQEYIPIPLEDAILDFQVLEEFAGEEGVRMLRVLVVAAVKDMIDAVVQAIAGAGLEPVRIDYSAFAAIRSITDPVPSLLSGREAEVVIDIGGGVSTVVVHERGKPRFVRVLPSGSSDVTQALVMDLGMAVEEAERHKMSWGLAGPSEAPQARVIERLAGGLLDDIRSSVEYYQSQSDAAPIGRVLLIGGGSRMPGLGDRLASVLHLTVEEGRPLAHVKLGKLGFTAEQLEQVSAVGAVAVGLALEGA